LLDTFGYDWANFTHAMLNAASEGYGSPGFVDLAASNENIISPLQSTDLEILAAIAPASRVRNDDDSTVVYLGNEPGSEKLWTVALPLAWVVDNSANTSGFFAGVSQVVGDNIDPTPDEINIYLARTSNNHSWEDWTSFYLYSGNGTTTGNQFSHDTYISERSYQNNLRPFFGGEQPTTLQVAAISSAAAGSASPLAPISYTQHLSIGQYVVYIHTVKTVWRVLAGIAAGLGAGIILGVAVAQLRHRYNICWYCSTSSKSVDGKDPVDNNIESSDVKEENSNDDGKPAIDEPESVVDTNVNNVEYNNCCCCSCEHPAKFWGIGCGIFLGIIAGVLTATFYGLGSIIVPNVYDEEVDKLYQSTSFDNFAVCSQWPNLPCQTEDAYLIDGWFADNPALPINIGHMQQKIGINETIKVILTNCNDVWDSEWNRAQYLAYFSTYFNENIVPGNYSWGPGWFVPSRSQQIFSEYLDPAGLDAILEPIADSNMTTALLQGTTIGNPAYNVRAGQKVEMLLLNANANITTFVIGKTAIETYTQPLADMASHIAGSQELLARVKSFVTE
jgi:hypothetical protein